MFISYDRKTDPIEHVSHYIQMMSLITKMARSYVKYSLLVLGLLLYGGLMGYGMDQFIILES